MGKEFGDRLQGLLRDQGVTQKDLAIRIGTTEATISRYVSGDREPKADVLANIATALHTTSDYLLGIERDEFDFPIVKLNTYGSVYEDEQAWANGYLEHVAFPSGNTDVMPSSPIEMNSADVPPTVPAFGVGAHTEEILQDLGYTQEELRQMIESGAAVG